MFTPPYVLMAWYLIKHETNIAMSVLFIALDLMAFY